VAAAGGERQVTAFGDNVETAVAPIDRTD